jgi:hypothetical protein
VVPSPQSERIFDIFFPSGRCRNSKEMRKPLMIPARPPRKTVRLKDAFEGKLTRGARCRSCAANRRYPPSSTLRPQPDPGRPSACWPTPTDSEVHQQFCHRLPIARAPLHWSTLRRSVRRLGSRTLPDGLSTRNVPRRDRTERNRDMSRSGSDAADKPGEMTAAPGGDLSEGPDTDVRSTRCGAGS